MSIFQEHWHETFSSDLSWSNFCAKCEEFAGETHENNNSPAQPPPPCRPAAGRPAAGRPIPRFDPVAAKRIQSLYRHSKKRAAWKLLCETSVTDTGSVHAASEYLMLVLEEKYANMNILAEDLKLIFPSGKDHNLTKDLYADVFTSEVAAKLRSAANTSLGSDHVKYAHLK